MKLVKSDFNDLWHKLRSVYVISNKLRMVAVLDNHIFDKRSICQKLGVICDIDINRISSILVK